MDLEQAQRALTDANGRIAGLEEQIATLAGERDAATGRAAELEAAQAALDARLVETTGAQAEITAHLTETQRALSAAHERGLTFLRRALLAEHADQVIPELVRGDDEETLLASVEVAKQAYSRTLEAARTAIASQTVPAGAPSARGAPAAGLSPLEMIESGLRK